MSAIYFTEEDLKNMELINHGIREGDISIYNLPSSGCSTKNYDLLKDCVIKTYCDSSLIKTWLSEEAYNDYIENKHQKTLAFSKLNLSEFKFLNVLQGPIYLNKSFFGSYQKRIFSNTTLYDKCHNPNSKDFFDTSLMVNFAEQIQRGFQEELHPNAIYTDDFGFGNLLVEDNNNIHLIDADGFRIDNFSESTYFVKLFFEDDPSFPLLKHQNKYMEYGVLRSSKEKDIFHVYENFIRLITKTRIDEFSVQEAYDFLVKTGFPFQFIESFSKCLSDEVPNEYINQDIFDRIKTDYKINTATYFKSVDGYCKLQKK